MDVTARVLLQLEHHGDPAVCLLCGSAAEVPHAIDCTMDIALSERGFYTAGDRNAARARLKYASATTLPAAASDQDPDEL